MMQASWSVSTIGSLFHILTVETVPILLRSSCIKTPDTQVADHQFASA